MSVVELLVAEVEGALLTPDGVLTRRAARAVEMLRGAGIELAITSGRPPRGLRVLIERLGIVTPVSALGGAVLVRPDLSVLLQRPLDDGVAMAVIACLERHGADVWIYQGDRWLVRRADTPRVAREQATVQFPPEVVERWDAVVGGVLEIVGVSDDAEAMARCESDLQAYCAHVSAWRSRQGFVDVTHPRANVGELVKALSTLLRIPGEAIATIGHRPCDVFMFRESGLSIAMGQACARVQQQAQRITLSNTDEGFAYAVETWLLAPRGGGPGDSRAGGSAVGRVSP